MKLIGELIEVISDRAGLNNVRAVGESLKSGRRSSEDGPIGPPLGGVVKDLLDVVGSDLLDFGQLVITGMKKTTGEGAPDTGARFGHGHAGFNKLTETLQSAVPDDSWNGAGSRAYADQNTRQQLRTETMADADREVHRVLFRESAQITLRRGFLDDQSNFLAKTSYVTFPLQFIPRYGEAAKLAIEIAALQVALGLSAEQIYRLHSEVTANAAELRQAVGRYSGVADGAQLPSASVDFDPPPPGGGAPTSTLPIERAERTTSGERRREPAGGAPARGDTGALAGGPITAMPDMPAVAPVAPAPAAPTPAAPMTAPSGGGAGVLGAIAGALGGLLGSAAQAAVQRAAASDAAASRETGRDDEPEDAPNKKQPEEAETLATAAPGDSASGRAPLHVEGDIDTDHPQAPETARLGPDTSPGPPAGTSPQDKK